VLSAPAQATVFHVAQNSGADTNDGSEANPLLNISACATRASAGDTCRVHAGTYRETVTLVHSGTAELPIRFEAAPGECATVSGLEPFTGTFTASSDGIWTAPVSSTFVQLFAGNTMLWEAQWPNRTSTDWFELPQAAAAAGTDATRLVDPNIPPGDWTGASVFMFPGARWQSITPTVTAYDPGSHTLSIKPPLNGWGSSSDVASGTVVPIPSSPYYLFGSRLALDAQNEWVIDNGSLLYFSQDDPSNHGLAYKKRLWSFSIENAAYVELVGFHAFGAAVRVLGSHNTINSLTIEHPTHLRVTDGYYDVDSANHDFVCQVIGDDNVWKNTLITKSASTGLLIAGNRNRVENNIVEDSVYMGTSHAGFEFVDLQSGCDGNLLVHDTTERTGRAGVALSDATNSRVMFNQVSGYGLLGYDVGGIGSWGTDGADSEIAYNDVGGVAAFFSNGIYLDDGCKHFIVHHNVVHDSTYNAFCMKGENYFYNNTTQNVGTPFAVAKNNQTGNWDNINLARAQNNLTDGTLLVSAGVLPSIDTDYGYFTAPIHVTADWQHVTMPFASMTQSAWVSQVPFDLTAIKQISFTPMTNGDFEFDIDNLALDGPVPRMLHDFEDGTLNNALGGSAWGGGSVSTGTLELAAGGPSGSAYFAKFSGTVVSGDSWLLMTEDIPNADFSAYRGLSMDVRGGQKSYRLATTYRDPENDHNVVCSFSGSDVPECAQAQGIAIPGITDSAVSATPDVGARQSGQSWTAGAARPDDTTSCGLVADLVYSLGPKPVVSGWSDAGISDTGGNTGNNAEMDGGIAATGGGRGGAEAGSASGGLGAVATSANGLTVSGGGCGCRVAGHAPKATWLAAALLLSLWSCMRVRRASRDV
jgi:hypothetical protein